MARKLTAFRVHFLLPPGLAAKNLPAGKDGRRGQFSKRLSNGRDPPFADIAAARFGLGRRKRRASIVPHSPDRTPRPFQRDSELDDFPSRVEIFQDASSLDEIGIPRGLRDVRGSDRALPAEGEYFRRRRRGRDGETRRDAFSTTVGQFPRRRDERQLARGVQQGIQKVPHPRLTVQSGLGALFIHLSTITVDGAVALPPSRPAHFGARIFPL